MIRRVGAGFVFAVVAACLVGGAVPALGAGAKTAAARSGPGGPVLAKAPPPIAWREWSREAFDEAKAKKKLVLLDITATWCHSCRVMAEESYTDSAAIAEVDSNFIPIRVDYDLRPDIGDRYLTNGWPTTAVLSSNGHLLLAKTYLPPRELQRFLHEGVQFYRINRQQVDRKVAEAEKAVERTWAPDSLLPPTLTEEEYIQQNIDALVSSEDKVHGGFGSAPKTARWDAISFLLRAADARGDDALRALAVRATAAALVLQDSLDGGFFRFALDPDWTRIRYERLLDEQAEALSILTRVYRATGEERFKTAGGRVREFSKRLNAGIVFDSPEADRLPWRQSMGPDVPIGNGKWMDGEVYFRLSRAARARQQRPPVSPNSTADATGRMISALLASDRSQPEPDLISRTTNQLRRLYRRLGRGNGSIYHAQIETRRTAPGLLADHVAVGNAFLDAYELGPPQLRRDCLAASDTIAAWMLANLEDRMGGGFRYAPRDTSSIGRARAGDKPEIANIEAGLFFLRRYWLNGRAEDKEVAERTSRVLQSGDKIVLDPGRAELALMLRVDPVRLLVIGGGKKGTTKLEGELRTAALQAPVSEVVVRYLDAPLKSSGPIAWPDGPPRNAVAPAIYRWTDSGWRGPVTDPKRLHEILDTPVAGE